MLARRRDFSGDGIGFLHYFPLHDIASLGRKFTSELIKDANDLFIYLDGITQAMPHDIEEHGTLETTMRTKHFILHGSRINYSYQETTPMTKA